MTRKHARRVAVTATLLVLGMAAVTAADAPPAREKGDMWEVTSQMSMEGMPMAMPAQTTKVCAPKDWKEPPAPADEQRKCKNSDFKTSGSTVSWKVTCAGPPAMTGDGEITRDGADAYTGLIKFASAEGSMKIKLGGKRTGVCDLPAK